MLWKLVAIWLLGSTVLVTGVARFAHGAATSPAIRAACDGDVKRLCPKEFKSRNSIAICRCMNALSLWQMLGISAPCKAAWRKEHGLSKGECK
jgi:hypothetical protein